MDKVLIIAEAGVNHNGDIDTAKKMIDAAAEAGADVIKFQTFIADKMVTEDAEMAGYQITNTGVRESQYAMIKRLELSEAAHIELEEHAKYRRIDFLSSPFDLESIGVLARLRCGMLKIPSGEITNLPYLRAIAQVGSKLILSTGMSSLGEIESALSVLAENGAKDVAVLHCNTEYPTPFIDVNLRAMQTIREAFKVTVGYSDHTIGIEVPIAAVALGARIIEKHFTLDKSMEGPDHCVSLDPSELAEMVRSIRRIEMALGDGVKRPSASEKRNMIVVRKSIVAKVPIRKGEPFNESNLTVKRPGSGIHPMEWDRVMNRRADRDYERDEQITI